MLRFCDLLKPRLETALSMLIGAGCLWLALASHRGMEGARALMLLVSVIIVQITSWLLLWRAWKSGKSDQRWLAPFVIVVIAANIHDALEVSNVLTSNIYYATMASYFLLLGMALILSARFVRSLQRIENFNTELTSEVQSARAELAETLKRQHDLELSHARVSERLHIVRDLHDGFGGTLVGSIAAAEQAGDHLSPVEQLALLKSLRDDLRLIIDTTASAKDTPGTLLDQLIPVKHRLTQMLDSVNIHCRWDISGLEEVVLENSRTLDILRILQEALTNVMKHSKASEALVKLSHDQGRLILTITDNGKGIDKNKAGPTGMGLSSMQARATRLSATLDLQSSDEGTQMLLVAPLE